MPQRTSIVILGKDAESAEALRSALSVPGYARAVTSIGEAQKILAEQAVTALLIELNAAGDLEGFVSHVLKAEPGLEIVLFASATERARAARLHDLGCGDVFPRPSDPDLVRTVTDRAVELSVLRQRLRRWRASVPASDATPPLGSSPVMRAFVERISKLSAHEATVLFKGEPGSGKERAARFVHAHSARAVSPFVALDCAEDPELPAAALDAGQGGTLYLANVDALSAGAQARLQEILKAKKLDLRVISSTRDSLREAVHKNQFRDDLFWTLSGIAVDIPPLRERSGDIDELLRLFFGQACRSMGKKVPSIPLPLMNAIRAHNFPGNVSELKQLAGLLAALSEGEELTLAALPAQIMSPIEISRSSPEGALALKPIVHEFEKQFLIRALKAVGGNQSIASKILDIHRNTLILKMQELGIPNKQAAKGRKKAK